MLEIHRRCASPVTKDIPVITVIIILDIYFHTPDRDPAQPPSTAATKVRHRGAAADAVFARPRRVLCRVACRA